MSNLQSETVVLGGDSFSNSSTALHKVGARGVDKQGRVYRYVLAGAADLVAGNVVQAPAIVPNHLANTPPAVAAGAASFTYTPGATAGAANLYENGFLQVDTTPGNGYMYGVDSHAAITSATAFTLNMRTDDPVQVALTTSSRVGLVPSLFRGVIQCPVTTATGVVVGVATYPITAAQYGWILTWGPAAVLINGTPALGAAVVAPSATTAGSVDVITTTNLVTAQIVGSMMQIGVSGKNNAVFVKLYP
jgi:hypothetical protein